MSYKANRAFVNRVRTDIPDWAPVILDDQSLAYQLGVDNRSLWQIALVAAKAAANTPGLKGAGNHMWKRIEIPKGDDVRVVFEASGKYPARDPLRIVLKALSGFLFRDVPWPDFVDAYVPGRSIQDSCAKHAGHKTALAMDIKDFFPSVTKGQIRRALRDIFGFNHYICGLIAAIVTLEKRLPQGSLISPELANLVGWHAFDEKIVERLGDSGWVYSRYSDDILLSHPDNVDDTELTRAFYSAYLPLKEAGFWVNLKKTRVYGWGEGRIKRIKWLGLVINEKVNADRRNYRQLRQTLYIASVQGIQAQAEFLGEDPVKHLRSLQGHLSFLKPALSDSRYEKLREYLDAAVLRDEIEQQAKEVT